MNESLKMKNNILCGNCLETLKDIPDESIDLILTSPPYDNLRTYKGYEFDFKGIAQQLLRVVKKGGVLVWVVGDATLKGSETGSSFRQALHFMDIGFNLHDTMIYHKDNPVPTGGGSRYYQSFEYMFILSKGKPKTFNPIFIPRRNKHNDKRTVRFRAVTRNPDGSFVKKIVKINQNVKKQNVWTYIVSGGASTKDKIAHQHPAIFPEKLAEDHILSWSNEGDLVLDPMCGSGTTMKMAAENNRNYIGIDISKEYCAIAKERIKQLTPKR